MAACLITGTVAGVCGTLTVPENPSDPGGRKIGLKVDLIPAQSTATLEPVFFIAGGPGSSTIDQWAVAPATFPGLNVHHDIVLVDQRGTGQSHQLTLPSPAANESLADYARRALATMDGDPRYYTTSVAMDDLDAVRQALGYNAIDLYGGSYGATAVQYYLRQHGDHVAAAVLDGGSLIDVPLLELIAANSQKALNDLFARCLADPICGVAYPDLRNQFALVLQRLDRAPVTTSLNDASGKPVVVTHEVFAAAVHSLLLTAGQAAGIPWLVHQAWLGYFNQVAQIEAANQPQALVMSYEIVCSEAWARFDPAEVERTGAGSYYLSEQLEAAEQQAQACAFLPPGIVPANDAEPPRTDVPVLLLNGVDDPQDPPSNVAAAAQDMPDSFSLAVPAQGHTVGHVGCLPSVVVSFFNTRKADPAAAQACAASIPQIPFRT